MFHLTGTQPVRYFDLLNSHSSPFRYTLLVYGHGEIPSCTNMSYYVCAVVEAEAYPKGLKCVQSQRCRLEV